MMVTKKGHPKYCLTAYPGSGSTKIVTDGPLYCIEDVKTLARPESIRFVTQKCEADVANLGWDHDDVAELLGELTSQHYRDSEWCLICGSLFFPCDAYSICRMEFIPAARKQLPIEYFVKLAIGTSGNLVLIVSCHLPEDCNG